MSITKSYNKHTDTYYAYDTSYIWSEEQQKKIQKKVCIGQYDKSGNIVPNARRGRPSRKAPSSNKVEAAKQSSGLIDADEARQVITEALSEIRHIEKSLDDLTARLRMLESKVASLQARLIQKE